jgi:hypothetical protein
MGGTYINSKHLKFEIPDESVGEYGFVDYFKKLTILS